MITHLHHIIPRHAGGTDDPSNLIRLTIPEHADAHRTLYEEFGREEDRLAWMALSGMIGKEQIIREAMLIGAKKGGVIGGPRGGRAGKGKKKHDGFGAKLSISITGKGNHRFGHIMTDEEKLVRSVSAKLHIEAIGGAEAWRGTVNLKNSTIERINAGTHPSQKTWTCEHCGKSSKGTGNYVRYHGIKCKSLIATRSSS